MHRRVFISALGVTGLAVAGAGVKYWPDQGIWNPCLPGPLPQGLAAHELVKAAWEDIDPTQLWDSHVHLAGAGDSESGVWVNPANYRLSHPLRYLLQKVYLNASCADTTGEVDVRFLRRLLTLQDELAKGGRLMLLAFDYFYDEQGRRRLERSAFHTPNEYAQRLVRRYPERFEWIASIHPYKPDALVELERAKCAGARAIKWLPSAMGMDPASSRCDRFYEALARLNMPLLSHAGREMAVPSAVGQDVNNPLRLRRALDHGVRVIVAHCASLGSDVDLDRGANGPRVASLHLFARMMGEARYDGLLFGDISAMTQTNRIGNALNTVLARSEWHARLVNGSDYPLPAVMPIFSMRRMVAERYVTQSEATVLSAVRRYNPLLFDFLLKRHVKVGDKRFDPSVFHSRKVFDNAVSMAS